MQPHYSVIDDPADEPITYAEAADHLRVDSDDDESYITALIPVAREFIEGVTGRACIDCGYKLTAECFEAIETECNRIPLYRVPLLAINSVSYYAPESDTLTTLAPSAYRYSTATEPGILQIIDGYPAVSDRTDAVQITFRSGYDNQDKIRPMMKHAVKVMLTHLYEERSPVAAVDLKEIPFSLRNIIANLKVGGWS